MSFFSEFREFAVKGNVVDLAVGVIIGAAFGKIVDSLVKDVIMPVVGLIKKSEYKRRQAPPGVRITFRGFGKDWRYPITSKYRE